MRPLVAALFGAGLFVACGGGGKSGSFFSDPGTNPGNPNDPNNPNPGNDGGPSLGTQTDAAPAGPCTGLECQQHACSGGGSTTISGTVYDPARKNPLYDVVVYVPNTAVGPLKTGASCDACDALYTGSPITTALTDASGKFTLKNAPDGANIPLVIQIGKWRKQITLANVAQCADNPQPDKSLALPKNHAEGDIPNIAISTGGADTLECLLGRVGLDASEYGPGPGGAGRIHIFQGTAIPFGLGPPVPNTSPGAPDSPSALWAGQSSLLPYDIVLLSCEGEETQNMNQQALFDYAAAGGRVFSSHFHYAWFDSGPFGAANLASWSTGSNNMGDINANIVTTLPNNQPFPKGQALQQWLTNVNALPGGKLPIAAARHNADVSASNTSSQPWIVADQGGATEYFTFDTPLNVAPEKKCGRVVFSDLHVGAASGDYASNPSSPVVPSGCANNDLSPQEKALEFMLFDLSSCVTPNNQPPQPPPPVR